jgi:hypothetical protein
MNFGDKYQFKKELIELVLKKTKVFERYEVNRGVSVTKELRNFRIRNQALRKTIKQVNFIYSGSNGYEYALTTTSDFLETISNESVIKEAYEEAKLFLEQKEYDFLLEDLRQLYFSNLVYDNSDTEVSKTIDHIVSIINNSINNNGNDKKSKHERTPETRLRHDDVIKIKGNIS